MPGFPAAHMDVRMAKYSKSRNSTKRPSVSEHETWPLFTCNLKENTGLLNPVIRIHASDWDFDSDGSSKGYTYVYLPRWQRCIFHLAQPYGIPGTGSHYNQRRNRRSVPADSCRVRPADSILLRHFRLTYQKVITFGCYS